MRGFMSIAPRAPSAACVFHNSADHAGGPFSVATAPLRRLRSQKVVFFAFASWPAPNDLSSFVYGIDETFDCFIPCEDRLAPLAEVIVALIDATKSTLSARDMIEHPLNHVWLKSKRS